MELSEEDVMMNFLESLLDRARYSDCIMEMINDIAKGVMDTPKKDVNQVYVLVNTRLIIKRGNIHYKLVPAMQQWTHAGHREARGARARDLAIGVVNCCLVIMATKKG